MMHVKLDHNTMVYGNPIPWTSDRLHQTILGLCCASIDESVRPPGFRDFMCQGAHSNW